MAVTQRRSLTRQIEVTHAVEGVVVGDAGGAVTEPELREGTFEGFRIRRLSARGNVTRPHEVRRNLVACVPVNALVDSMDLLSAAAV